MSRKQICFRIRRRDLGKELQAGKRVGLPPHEQTLRLGNYFPLLFQGGVGEKSRFCFGANLRHEYSAVPNIAKIQIKRAFKSYQKIVIVVVVVVVFVCYVHMYT